MKKLFGLILLAGALAGCNQKPAVSGECVIKGTVNDPSLEGKRIFLVPVEGPNVAAYVDSFDIKDGKFEFHKDTVMMAKILMDYRYRYDKQVLLVVTEPGILEVHIDSVSSAKGTPQNDLLQNWKDITEVYNSQMRDMSRNLNEARRRGDSLRMKSLKTRMDSINIAYKQTTRKMAKEMDDCVLKDFLGKMFPLTYKRKMPDGTIVEMDADTNQPVKGPTP